MPDITMCSNVKCPIREDCHRFTAKPFPYGQSYAKFQPVITEDKVECDYFWDNKNKQ